MIECDPYINFGQPALKGRRLTVYDIVTKILYEGDVKLALIDYAITLADAKEAVVYCMNLKCKRDKDLVHFCDGCILRTIEEGWNFNKDDYLELKRNGESVVISKDNTIFFAGTLKALEDSEFGKVTWLIAEDVNKML